MSRCECEEGVDIRELCLNCGCQTMGCTSKRPIQREFELVNTELAQKSLQSALEQ